MPPALKNPSQELLLKILTGVVTVLGSLLLGLITLVWNGIDDRLANIETSHIQQQRSIVILERDYDHLEQKVERHDLILARH